MPAPRTGRLRAVLDLRAPCRARRSREGQVFGLENERGAAAMEPRTARTRYKPGKPGPVFPKEALRRARAVSSRVS